MYSKYSLKFVFLALFYAFTVLIIAALLIQIISGGDPCPLCIVQRYALILGAVASLLGGLHNSRGFMRRIYSGIALLASLSGLAAAFYQRWVQTHTHLDYIGQIRDWINAVPFAHIFPGLLEGSGSCLGNSGVFLGWTIAQWTLACFAILCLLTAWQTLRPTPERRRFS